MDRLAAAGLLAASETDALPSHTHLGDFELIRRIGGGGMGVVYLAQQQALGRRVALKVVHPELLYFPGVRERFKREVEIVARLQHPGIVPIYSVGEDGGTPYFAMELVEGCSLAQALQDLQGAAPGRLTGRDLARVVARRAGIAALPDSTRAGPLFSGSWVDACVHIARSVADSLEYVHERSVLHRDVKPSNVLITVDGRVLLTDFGLASAEGVEALTRTSSQLGSLLYMAPELLRGQAGLRHDRRCDVYSAGVTLYEALTLRAAFGSREGEESIRRSIRDGRHAAIATLNRAVPRDVATMCAKAMEPDPARRYPQASAFAADLQRYVERRPILARRAGPLLRLRRYAQRHPVISVGICLTTAAITSFLVWQQGEWRRSQGLRLIADARTAVRTDPTLALLLAIEGAERVPGQAANEALLESLDVLHETWNVTPGPELAGVASAAEFSRDGRLIATGRSGWLLILDALSGQMLHRLPQPGDCRVLRFSADGARLFLGSRNPNRWTIFDVGTWQVIARGETEARILAVDQDLERMLLQPSAGTGLAPPVVWDLRSDAVFTALACGGQEVHQANFDPAGLRLAAVVSNPIRNHVALFDSVSGALLAELGPHDGGVWDAEFSPDGALLATASDAETAWIWNLEARRPVLLARGHSGGVYRARFSPDGRRLATLSQEDGTVRVWSLEPESGGLEFASWSIPLLTRAEILHRHGTELRHVAFDATGERLVTCTLAGACHLWSHRSLTRVATLSGELSQDRYGALSGDGHRLLTIRGNASPFSGAGRLWNATQGTLIADIGSESEPIGLLRFVNQEQTIAGIAFDAEEHQFRCWDGFSGAPVAGVALPFSSANMTYLAAVAPCGEVAATASSIGSQPLRILHFDHRVVDSAESADFPVGMAFSPDSSLLACAFSTPAGYVLRIRNWRAHEWLVQTAMPARMERLGFSRDGRQVLAMGDGACLVDVASGAMIARLDGHEDRILSCDFSPQGRWLATASADRTARIWSLPGGRLHAVVRGHERRILDARFLDESSLLTASSDGTIRRWPVHPLPFAVAHKPRELTDAERRRWLDAR